MAYTCRTCGVSYDERPTCFIADEPAAVAELSDEERGKRVERGSDQCVLDEEHFFILGNLDVPIVGRDEGLRWTVWSTLSEKNFERAAKLWQTPGRESEPAYFGWLSNQIPGYPPTVNIKALVHTQPVGVRPLIRVIEEGHLLALEQERGIDTVRADELIHAALHGEGRADDET